MASFNESDEIPMLPISDSSRSFPSTNRSHSLSIPTSSIEGFNNFQKASGCTGPLRTRRLHSSVQLTTPMEPSDSTSGVSSQPERYPSFDSIEPKPSNEDESVEFHDGRSWARRNASFLTTFFAFSCLLAIFIDPLFFFIISFNKNNKCMVIDWSMTHGFLAVRTLTDFIFFLNIGLQFWLAYVAHERRGGGGELVDQSKKVVVLNFILDLFIVLPLPQILILEVIPKTLHESVANHTKNVLGTAVLLQYIPKLYRVIPMLVGQTHTHFIVESAWANFVINLLTFMLAGHVVGSCWYFFGLRRVNKCLREACDSSGYKCRVFIDCGYGKSNTLGFQSQRAVWSNNLNATACFEEDRFPYGIYLKAVKLTSNSNILTRYIYSVFWGFQQISTLAGNLVPSHNIGEVLFTMGIIGLGLFLFALLIGNMHNFIQALGKRRFEMTLRRRDVEQWMSHRKLPKDIRKRVIEFERFNWAATRGVNEDFLFANMPEDLQRDIRRHLFKFLNKVEMFSSMEEPILDVIRERLKQITYIKGSKVLHSKCIVEKMVFIVRGQMQSIEEDGSSSVRLLSEEDVCGEELFTWCLQRSALNPADGTKMKMSSNSKVLLSKRGVTCMSNVEAFSLSVADVEYITDLYSKFQKNLPVQGPIRNESLNWKHRAAMKIQVAWRNSKKRLHQRLCTAHSTSISSR